MSSPTTFKAPEWKARKRWNPYNSFKLVAHIELWKNIRRGRPVPAPVLITVDPANICDLKCAWCNAKYIRDHRNRLLSEKALFSIADFLPGMGQLRRLHTGRSGRMHRRRRRISTQSRNSRFSLTASFTII